jgi:antitoxin MazE
MCENVEIDMNLKVKAQKWGNSLGMRIPKVIADELQLTDSSELELEISGANLIVRQYQEHQYRIEDLLRKINSRNIHTEIDTGEPCGEEIW